MNDKTGRKDFFISYNSADKKIAEWIAWTLEAAGYSTIIQAWDFLAGEQFPVMMQMASVKAERTIAVLTGAYLGAIFTQPEWAAAFVQDPTGEKGLLIPVRVEDFEPPGMFRPMIYIDLVGLEERQAEEGLLSEIKRVVSQSRRKPGEKPGFSPVPKKPIKPRPGFEIIPVMFHQPDLGRVDEMVGREEAIKWLEAQFFGENINASAITSLHGAGGMGKTFLARVFAERFNDRITFLPVYLGETSPFDAGLSLLRLQLYDTSTIDREERLVDMLHSFYSSGSGIILLDDARGEDAKILFPQVSTWRVLLTTRDKALARRLCGDRNVKELDSLGNYEAMTLMRNVLGNRFIEKSLSDYQELCIYLANRPYAIRLAAGYLAGALDPSPCELLGQLKRGTDVALDDDYSFKRLASLLKSCLEQLGKKSSPGMTLVRNLSVCSDQGISVRRFIEWQVNIGDKKVEEIEQSLNYARELGIVLVEDEKAEYDSMEERNIRPGTGLEGKRFRLHTDLLRTLRGDRYDKEESMVNSLINYLGSVLIEREYGENLERSLHAQVFSLSERYRREENITRKLYDTFWIHLYCTGELKQAYELGEAFREQAFNNKNDLQEVTATRR